MKFLEKLIKKQNTMQRIIGLKMELVEKLTKNIEPLWIEQEKKRLSRNNRKRAIGAGHPYKLETMLEKVVVVLFYLKSYATQELIGIIFDIDQSNISRLFTILLPLIENAADPELKNFLNAAKETVKQEKIKTLEQLITKFPELRDVSIDATEQECYRASKYETQKEFYSGKSKQHSLKTQVTVSKTGKFLDISKSYPGKIHDKNIMNQEKTVDKFPKLVPQRFDSAYQGLRKEYPNHYVILHCKKPKNQELTPLEKEYNKANSKRRVVAEHGLSRLKKFRILSYLFRNPIESYNLIFRGIAAILNFKLNNNTKLA